MGYFIAGVLVWAGLSQAVDCDVSARREAMRSTGAAARDCGLRQAGLLERSGDDPSEIAVAAVQFCGSELQRAVDAAGMCRGDVYRRRFRLSLERNFRQVVIAEVVRLRAR
jgi:hypothetical protein